jgi:short-subunit dehydrogenase
MFTNKSKIMNAGDYPSYVNIPDLVRQQLIQFFCIFTSAKFRILKARVQASTRPSALFKFGESPSSYYEGSGTIVNISSHGGRIGLMPFLIPYHSSKFAVEKFTESLRQELAQFSINVILIEPWGIRSNFIDNSKNAKNYNPENSLYVGTIQKLFEGIQSIMADSSHTRDVAEVILKVVNTSSPPVGKDVESILKAGTELSDKELKNGYARAIWIRRDSYVSETSTSTCM